MLFAYLHPHRNRSTCGATTTLGTLRTSARRRPNYFQQHPAVLLPAAVKPSTPSAQNPNHTNSKSPAFRSHTLSRVCVSVSICCWCACLCRVRFRCWCVRFGLVAACSSGVWECEWIAGPPSCYLYPVGVHIYSAELRIAKSVASTFYMTFESIKGKCPNYTPSFTLSAYLYQ